MSDYTKVFDGAAKDAANSSVLGADHDTEFSAIATSIGTKMDKVVGVTTGNLVKLDSAGQPVDAEVAASVFAGLTGVVETRMDAVEASVTALTPPTVLSGHHRAGYMNLVDGSAASTAFDVGATTEVTWTTVGPTGSGATNIWASLDNVPSTGAVLILQCFGYITEGATAPASVEMWACSNDVASPFSDEGTSVYYSASAIASGDGVGHARTIYVPIDSSGIFKVKWDKEANTTLNTLDVYYRGYMGDYV